MALGEGILPVQAIARLVEAGIVDPALPLAEFQIQPASLDLRLGTRAWRVRASFLPGSRTVAERLSDVIMHPIELTEAGVVLEKGCVYIAELQERLALPAGVQARANPKSSTGRVDAFVRLLTDRGRAFDDVAESYDGPLYLEITPQTFSILVRPGTRLNQLRLKVGDHLFSRRGNPDDDRVARLEDLEVLFSSLPRVYRDFDRYTILERCACFYTVTEDERFIVRPTGDRAWVISACSGHGFKLAPVMARAVAQALTGERDAVDIPAWAAPA